MESVANSVEDYLVDGLSFQLEQGASYVVNRRSCTFFPVEATFTQAQMELNKFEWY